MARCTRCNKFMLIAPKSGFCKECELLNAQDKAREESLITICVKRLRFSEDRAEALNLL